MNGVNKLLMKNMESYNNEKTEVHFEINDEDMEILKNFKKIEIYEKECMFSRLWR